MCDGYQHEEEKLLIEQVIKKLEEVQLFLRVSSFFIEMDIQFIFL